MTEGADGPSQFWLIRGMKVGVLAVLVAALTAIAWWLSGGPLPDASEDGIQRFSKAFEYSLPVATTPGPRQGGMEPRVSPPSPADPAAWDETVRLPLRVEGRARPEVQEGRELPVGAWWYRVSYTVPAGVDGPLALYLPRVVGAAVQVVRHEHGRWIVRWDGVEQRREQWNRPVLAQLGEAGPPGSVVDVAVRLTRNTATAHSLTSISIGPLASLERRAHWRELFQLVGPEVSSLTFACLGMISLLYWLGRRRDHAYLLFALTSVTWTLRNLHYYVNVPHTVWGSDWFWWLSRASLSWSIVLILLFAMRFDARSHPRIEKGLAGFALLVTVLTMPLLPLLPVAALDGASPQLLNAGISFVGLSWLSLQAWQRGGRELRTITAALWVTVLAGVHDLLLAAGRVPMESVYLLPLATLVVFLSFLLAAQARYSKAMWQVEHVNAELELRLAEREAQLRANHERLRGVEREQALLLERQRLTRDMHDGLGSTLMSSLVLVEQGKLDSAAVAVLLRECVDDLRLVIDSLEPIGHDLVTLLASLRHRLGQRLESAGLVLKWEVEDLPPLEWLQPPDALQVLRTVQEALTNVLRHAQARSVRILTRQVGSEVQVLIEDDGIGFDTLHPVRGRGLRHMEQRALRLGGRLHLDSGAGQGTRVSLWLPLWRAGAA